MIDDKAIEKIANLGRDAAYIQMTDLADVGDPDRYAIKVDGMVAYRDKPPRPKKGDVVTLDDMIAAAKKWDAATVWHKNGRVVALHDDVRRDDRTVWDLQTARPFATLRSLNTSEPIFMPQKAMIRLLTYDLADAIRDAAGLVSAIRQISFKRSSDGAATVEHGKESLGRSVEEEVQGRGEIPETFVLHSPVFIIPGAPVLPVRMALEINCETQQLAIRPLPDELVKAEQETHGWIHEQLVEALPDTTAVFYGEPR